MRRLVALLLGVVAVIWLSGTAARAGTLADCLAKHHVCVTSHGRALISQSQQDQLERQIGSDDIYLVVAASGASGYDAAMQQIIRTLDAQQQQFVVGFLDSERKHFGADNQGVLPAGAAANIATSVVRQHQSDQDIFAAMQDFVRQVQQEAQAPGSRAAASSPPSHTARNVLIVPSLFNWDASMHKQFRITERQNIGFRREAFNPLESPELGRAEPALGQFEPD